MACYVGLAEYAAVAQEARVQSRLSAHVVYHGLRSVKSIAVQCKQPPARGARRPTCQRQTAVSSSANHCQGVCSLPAWRVCHGDEHFQAQGRTPLVGVYSGQEDRAISRLDGSASAPSTVSAWADKDSCARPDRRHRYADKLHTCAPRFAGEREPLRIKTSSPSLSICSHVWASPYFEICF